MRVPRIPARTPSGRRTIALLTTAAALALFGLAPALGAPRPAAAQSRRHAGLDRAERAKLARGELVVRRDQVRRGSRLYMGGASWQRIDLPPGALWRATLDVPRYHRLLPEVTEARVLRRDGPERRLVYLRHAKGPVAIEYALWFTVEDGARIARFRVDQSHRGDIRSGWGYLAVYPYVDGHSVLSYGIQADIGRGLFQSMVRPQVHEWMLRVPQTVKWYVEGRGRNRYLRQTARAR